MVIFVILILAGITSVQMVIRLNGTWCGMLNSFLPHDAASASAVYAIAVQFVRQSVSQFVSHIHCVKNSWTYREMFFSIW